MTGEEVRGQGPTAVIRQEMPVVLGAITTLLFWVFGDAWLVDLSDFASSGALFLWIFVVMLWCAFGVVRHADSLADLLGEPYGTLILTISVIGIEVSLIVAIMLTADKDPTLARDTMFAILMIVLNGMVGLVLLVGGFRHGVQNYNLQGARAFLAVIVPLSAIALILPVFTRSTPDPSLAPMQAILFAVMTALLYIVFLAIQTVLHRGFFVQPVSASGPGASDPVDEAGHADHASRSVSYHAVLLLLTMAPIILLSKKLAVLVDYGIASLAAPAALGGILIAIVVLTPEGIAAARAALANRLQRSVNICLGSTLSTIGMTVPAVVVVGLVTGQHVVLGLDPSHIVLLLLTLFVSALTFVGVQTNILLGAVHLVLFFVYIVLIFSP